MSITEDILKQLKEIISRKFGEKGYYLFILILVLLLPAIFWKNISESLVYTEIKEYFTSLPTPTQDKYTIIVANLENDHNRSHTINLISSLNSKMKGVSIIPLKKTIKAIGDGSQNSFQIATKQAKEYLTKVNANVIIWGYVHTEGKETGLELHLDFVDNSISWPVGAYRYQEVFYFEDKLYSDLIDIITMLVSANNESYNKLYANQDVSNLHTYIERVEHILKSNLLTEKRRNEILQHLATAQLTEGQFTGDKKKILQSISTYEYILNANTQDQKSENKVIVKTKLASAQLILGEMDKNRNMIEESIATCESTLEALNPKDDPEKWASVELIIAKALTKLSESNVDQNTLDKAISACTMALINVSQERNPIAWAEINTVRGYLTYIKGSSTSNQNLIDNSISIINKSINPFSNNTMPSLNAQCYVYLSKIYFETYVKGLDINNLRLAQSSSHKAIGLTSPKFLPELWITAKYYSGIAQTFIGFMNRDINIIGYTEEYFKNLKNEYILTIYPTYTTLCYIGIITSEFFNYKLTNDKNMLTAAINNLNAVNETISCLDNQKFWISTQVRLADLNMEFYKDIDHENFDSCLNAIINALTCARDNNIKIDEYDVKDIDRIINYIYLQDHTKSHDFENEKVQLQTIVSLFKELKLNPQTLRTE